MYLVEQENPQKVVKHFGVLDIGNVLSLAEAEPWRPVVVDQAPPQLRSQWLDESRANWKIIGKIVDEVGARARLREAECNPLYDLFGNNCEHFANFMANGQRSSPQLFAGLMLVAAAIGVYALAKQRTLPLAR
ncbi:MAG TPA: hypothetical protein VGM20_08920 [Gemmatimonadales bacterium]